MTSVSLLAPVGRVLTHIFFRYSKSTAHDEEVQKLYEEMENQIKGEKERILNEVCVHIYQLYMCFDIRVKIVVSLVNSEWRGPTLGHGSCVLILFEKKVTCFEGAKIQ